MADQDKKDELGRRLEALVVGHYLDTGTAATRADLARRAKLTESSVGRWIRTVGEDEIPGVQILYAQRSFRGRNSTLGRDRWVPSRGRLRNEILKLQKELAGD